MPDQNQEAPMTKTDAKEMMDNPYKREMLFTPQNRSRDYAVEIDNLTEKIEALESYIKSIFDGHVLINGQFLKITP